MTLLTPLFIPSPFPLPRLLPTLRTTPRPAIRRIAMSTRPSALVSPSWLASQTLVTILDASWYMPSQHRNPHAEYLAEHIPNARFFNIDAPGLADPSSPFPHMLPTADEFQRAVTPLGVAQGTPVVVYARRGFVGAARAWWMFRVFGKEDVFVLDGGLEIWKRDSRPVESGEVGDVTGGDLFVATRNEALVRTMTDMLAQIESKEGVIVDARAQGRFDGVSPEPRPDLLKGHMPGAFCVPSDHLVDMDGKMRPPDELREKFRNGGVDDAILTSSPLSLTCGSGVTAAINCLALHELGVDAAVYDGSWTEYGSHLENPVEQNL